MVAQIPMPRVFVVDDPSMNAFATGSSPKNAAVAATTGLLAVMNREELEGVIGHEVSHIRNYDIRISTIAVALASAITMLAGMARNMMFWVEVVVETMMTVMEVAVWKLFFSFFL